MELFFVFAPFVICMILCLWLNITMIIPIAAGFILFTAAGVRRGHKLQKILQAAWESIKDSLIVVLIMILIGCLTGMWRRSGTAAYFVAAGVSLIPSAFFLPAAFLLTSAMSFALGTSFGVSATAGVILMSIARAGNVSPVLAAGAILSGVYVGDRGSPAASSGNLVAVLTHTDMRKNVRIMFRSALIPFVICLVLYSVLSFFAPMDTADSSVSVLLNREFTLSIWCILPAVFMIFLPFCGLAVKYSMLVSLVLSVIVSITLQGSSLADCLQTMVMGYTPHTADLENMLGGGGITSMRSAEF